MELTVLTDNNTYIDRYYLGEPGVSYYIEDGDSKILFDTGYSDVYLRNAKALGIDLNSIDTLALSHGHNDHSGGLKYFPANVKPSLIAHPAAFAAKRAGEIDIGAPFSVTQVAGRFTLRLTRVPVKLSAHITFLGEIPRITSFEAKKPLAETKTGGKWQSDYLPDDTALVYKSDKGLYIITGCSHSGICNIIEYAKKVSGDDRLAGLIGGMHLFGQSAQLDETIAYLKKQQPLFELYPCHCTDFIARSAIYRELEIREVGVGLHLSW